MSKLFYRSSRLLEALLISYFSHCFLSLPSPYSNSTPNEFRFVALGDDWPSVSEWGDESATQGVDDLRSKPRIRLNPIRRAAKWMASRRRS